MTLEELLYKKHELQKRGKEAKESGDDETLKEILAEIKEINEKIEAKKEEDEEEDEEIKRKIDSYLDDKEEILSESALITSERRSQKDFKRKFSKRNKGLNISKYMKGLLFNDWHNAENEARAFTQKVDGSAILPEEIVSEIVYKAINNSVLLGHCPILPMEAGTSIIGKISEDPELEYKKPYELGKETGLGLSGIKLNAKTLYAWLEISEEDLQDIENLNEIIPKALGDAVAESVDRSFLYSGEFGKEEDSPIGILDNPNILTVEADKVDYDMIGQAMLDISRNNGIADTVALNPNEYYKLQMLKDQSGQYIQSPEFYNGLNKINSNAIDSNEALVFDSNQIVVGIRKDMDIKALPDLTKGTVLVRVMFRADVQTLRENHICKIVVSSK